MDARSLVTNVAAAALPGGPARLLAPPVDLSLMSPLTDPRRRRRRRRRRHQRRRRRRRRHQASSTLREGVTNGWQ